MFVTGDYFYKSRRGDCNRCPRAISPIVPYKLWFTSTQLNSINLYYSNCQTAVTVTI